MIHCRIRLLLGLFLLVLSLVIIGCLVLYKIRTSIPYHYMQMMSKIDLWQTPFMSAGPELIPRTRKCRFSGCQLLLLQSSHAPSAIFAPSMVQQFLEILCVPKAMLSVDRDELHLHDRDSSLVPADSPAVPDPTILF